MRLVLLASPRDSLYDIALNYLESVVVSLFIESVDPLFDVRPKEGRRPLADVIYALQKGMDPPKIGLGIQGALYVLPARDPYSPVARLSKDHMEDALEYALNVLLNSRKLKEMGLAPKTFVGFIFSPLAISALAFATETVVICSSDDEPHVLRFIEEVRRRMGEDAPPIRVVCAGAADEGAFSALGVELIEVEAAPRARARAAIEDDDVRRLLSTLKRVEEGGG